MIDEVHQLSSHAFKRDVVKTLEEPPEYVKFSSRDRSAEGAGDCVVACCSSI